MKIDIHNRLTNRIFDLGSEAQSILEGETDWDEARLLEIADELTKLEGRLDALNV